MPLREEEQVRRMYQLLIDFLVAPKSILWHPEAVPWEQRFGQVYCLDFVDGGHWGHTRRPLCRKSPLLELGYLLSVQEPLWSSPSCAPSHSTRPFPQRFKLPSDTSCPTKQARCFSLPFPPHLMAVVACVHTPAQAACSNGKLHTLPLLCGMNLSL